MSDLDKKLKGVLSMVHIGYKSSAGECNTTLTPNQVASYVMLSIRELGYMTGEEFYARFEKELVTLSRNIYKVDKSDPHFWDYYINNGDAIEAAKKAAGIK